jgi:hypothetical protein
VEPIEGGGQARRRVHQGWSANPATARKASLPLRADRVKWGKVEIVEARFPTTAERANLARARIGTPSEHYGGIGGTYRPDRRAVELHEAVKLALK